MQPKQRPPIIIGFGHRARCGKDSVVKFIIDKYGKENGGPYDIRRYAFADALKQEVHGREKQLCDEHNIPYNPDPDGKCRELLQYWGTEWRRAQDADYWVKRLMSKIDIDMPQVALIADVRFKNEAAWIKDREGYYIKVERYTSESEKYYAPDIDHEHKSEKDLEFYTDHFAEIRCLDGALKELEQSSYELFDMLVEDLQIVDDFLERLKRGEKIKLSFTPDVKFAEVYKIPAKED